MIIGDQGPELFIPQPKPEPDRRLGGYVIGVLTALIIIGLITDAFVHPVYWIGLQ